MSMRDGLEFLVYRFDYRAEKTGSHGRRARDKMQWDSKPLDVHHVSLCWIPWISQLAYIGGHDSPQAFMMGVIKMTSEIGKAEAWARRKPIVPRQILIWLSRVVSERSR